MGRTIPALAVLLGAAFFWFTRFGLAETESQFAARNGTLVNQTRPSQGFHAKGATARLPQKRSGAGNDVGGGTPGFGFAVKKDALKNARNRPTEAGRQSRTTYAMARPGFAYSRSRGAGAYPDEATATQGKNAGGRKAACTAEYWRSSKEGWPRMLPIASAAAKVFGSRALEAYGPRLTLLDGLRMEEKDAYSSLLKQSSAALINSYSREGFPYSAWRVKTLLIRSLVSQQAAAAQAAHFLLVNSQCS